MNPECTSAPHQRTGCSHPLPDGTAQEKHNRHVGTGATHFFVAKWQTNLFCYSCLDLSPLCRRLLRPAHHFQLPTSPEAGRQAHSKMQAAHSCMLSVTVLQRCSIPSPSAAALANTLMVRALVHADARLEADAGGALPVHSCAAAPEPAHAHAAQRTCVEGARAAWPAPSVAAWLHRLHVGHEAVGRASTAAAQPTGSAPTAAACGSPHAASGSMLGRMPQQCMEAAPCACSAAHARARAGPAPVGPRSFSWRWPMGAAAAASSSSAAAGSLRGYADRVAHNKRKAADSKAAPVPTRAQLAAQYKVNKQIRAASLRVILPGAETATSSSSSGSSSSDAGAVGPLPQQQQTSVQVQAASPPGAGAGDAASSAGGGSGGPASGSSSPSRVMTRDEALSMAKASGMDLVLVSERKTAHMHAWGGVTLRCMSLSTRTCVHHSCHAFEQGWRRACCPVELS